MPEFTVPQLLALAKDALSNRPKMYKKGGTVAHKGVNITHAELSPQALYGGAVFHPEHFSQGGGEDLTPPPIGHNMPPEPIDAPPHVDDYHGQHAAPGPDSGVPIHNLSGVYPDDFYGPNGFRYYADHGQPRDRDSYMKHVRARGNPDHIMSVYRAIPKDVYQKAMRQNSETPLALMIKKGDWVTPSKEYAKEHGEGALNGKYKVVARRVRAKDVYTNGDSIHEWGYHPEVKEHFSAGGAEDSAFIPHGDPEREQNLAAFNPIKDENGSPKVVYHGTTGDFSEFANNMLGANTGSSSAKLGHWFSDNPRVANSYGNYSATISPVQKILDLAEKAWGQSDWKNYDKHINEAEKLESDFNEVENRKRGQNIIPVHLSIKNPHVIDAKGETYINLRDRLSKEIQRAKQNKHDGIIVKNFDDAAGISELPATHYMVFHPHQIKSATGNRGTFDPKNPDITKARGGEVPHTPHPAMRIPGVHIVGHNPIFHGDE